MEAEDILGDSLGLIGEYGDSQGSDEVRYGDLVLKVAPKEGKALTLLADQLFSPSLLLAERIERRLIPLDGKTIVELGAGCAVPSLLTSTVSKDGPTLVVVTDYPDKNILQNLNDNIRRNQPCFNSSCTVVCKGYEWGANVFPLLDLLRSLSPEKEPEKIPMGYDIVILSDLLHFYTSHDALVFSLSNLLSKTTTARVYIAAGTYTPPHVCDNFVRLARERAGIILEEGEMSNEWKGRHDVWRSSNNRLSLNELGARKGMCRWWTGRWSADALEQVEIM